MLIQNETIFYQEIKVGLCFFYYHVETRTVVLMQVFLFDFCFCCYKRLSVDNLRGHGAFFEFCSISHPLFTQENVRLSVNTRVYLVVSVYVDLLFAHSARLFLVLFLNATTQCCQSLVFTTMIVLMEPNYLQPSQSNVTEQYTFYIFTYSITSPSLQEGFFFDDDSGLHLCVRFLCIHLNK